MADCESLGGMNVERRRRGGRGEWKRMNKFQRSMAADVVMKENTKYDTMDQSIDPSIHPPVVLRPQTSLRIQFSVSTNTNKRKRACVREGSAGSSNSLFKICLIEIATDSSENE